MMTLDDRFKNREPQTAIFPVKLREIYIGSIPNRPLDEFPGVNGRLPQGHTRINALQI